MAIALDASTFNNPGYVSSYSFSHTCTGSNLILIVEVGITQSGSNEQVNSITYNGVSLTKSIAITSTTPGVPCRAEIWYLVSPAPGSHTVAVTLSGQIYSGTIANSFTGVSGAPEATASKERGNGSGTVADMNITTLTNNAWAVNFLTCENNTNQVFTPGSNQVDIGDFTWAVGFNGGSSTTTYYPTTTAGTYTMAETLKFSDIWAHVAVSLPAGPSTTTSTSSTSSSSSSTSTSSTSSSTSSTSSSTSSTSISTSSTSSSSSTSSTSSSSSSSTSSTSSSTSSTSSSTSTSSTSSSSTSTTQTGTTTSSSSSTSSTSSSTSHTTSSSSSTSSTSSSSSSSSTSTTSTSTSTIFVPLRKPKIDFRL